MRRSCSCADLRIPPAAEAIHNRGSDGQVQGSGRRRDLGGRYPADPEQQGAARERAQHVGGPARPGPGEAAELLRASANAAGVIPPPQIMSFGSGVGVEFTLGQMLKPVVDALTDLEIVGLLLGMTLGVAPLVAVRGHHLLDRAVSTSLSELIKAARSGPQRDRGDRQSRGGGCGRDNHSATASRLRPSGTGAAQHP